MKRLLLLPLVMVFLGCPSKPNCDQSQQLRAAEEKIAKLETERLQSWKDQLAKCEETVNDLQTELSREVASHEATKRTQLQDKIFELQTDLRLSKRQRHHPPRQPAAQAPSSCCQNQCCGNIARLEECRVTTLTLPFLR